MGALNENGIVNDLTELSRNVVGGEIWSEVIADAVVWRRHLHQHPELAFNEHLTSDFVAARLTEFGLTVHRGLAGTGVVGSLVRGHGQRSIGIRADMDALPVQELSGVTHASCVANVMHACGHDGHVAMALAAARLCARLPELQGTVHFIFQPAEEGGGGARRMIEDGLFERFPCDAVFGLHNWPALPLGTCVARDGALMAASAVFEIVISGRGCHGAMPHEGTDALLAGCHLVSTLQSIVSRNVDPLQAAVVSATQFRAGDAHNVVPHTCAIRGTARWFDASIGDLLERRLGELSKAVAGGFGCTAEFRFERRYPATINSPAEANLVRKIARTLPLNLTLIDAPPTMGAEDFSFMLQAVPGCYFWLGARAAGHEQGLHSARYDFNDEVIEIGVALWVSLVGESLGEHR